MCAFPTRYPQCGYVPFGGGDRLSVMRGEKTLARSQGLQLSEGGLHLQDGKSTCLEKRKVSRSLSATAYLMQERGFWKQNRGK